MASAALATNAVSAGIKSASFDATNGGADPENPEQQEEKKDDSLITMQDFMEHPCLFAPIIVFAISGVFGFVALLVAWVGTPDDADDRTLGIIVGFTSLFVGLWAAWEIRSLGSLSDQIKQLKKIRQALEHQTSRLEGEVGEMAEENEELKENVDNLRTAGDELETQVNSLDTENDNLRNTRDELEKQNSALKDNVNKLNEQNEKLNATLAEMTTQNDRLQEDMKQFDELRGEMMAHAENAGEEFSEMVRETMAKYEQMDDLFRSNEVVLLRQLAAQVEFMDQSEGMDIREFKRYKARLPKRYKAIMEEQGITFEQMDSDGSGSIDPAEMTGMINHLIDSFQQKQNEL